MKRRNNHIRTVTRALVALFACLFSLRCLGLDPDKNLRQYVLRSWTSEQGLPQNSIRAALQTRDGFLWIGTLGGLARFDGAAFVIYKANVPNSIPNDSITGLVEDRDGSLWISSGGGLTRYWRGNFQNYGSRDGLPADSIWRIAADRCGGVWAVTWHGSLFHFNGKTVRRYADLDAALPEDVNALLEDNYGTLWIATFHGLFALSSDHRLRRFTAQNGVAGQAVYALALDRKGELWTAGEGGLSHHVLDHFVALPVHGLRTATLLAFDSTDDDNAIWTGSTEQGLFRLDSHGVERLRGSQGLTSDEVWLLYFSRDGSLWLGAVDGLNQLSDGAVTSFSIGEGVPASTLRIQRSQGANGKLWFGRRNLLFQAQDGKLIRLASTAMATSLTSKSKPASNLLPQRSAIPIWFHSNEADSSGLVLMDNWGRGILSDGVRTRSLPPIPWAAVGTMLVDHQGVVWVGGANIGVLAYVGHDPPRSYTVANGLYDDNVSTLAETASGDILVGTLSGVNLIRHGAVTHLVACANVTSIAPSPDGSFWISSESGLIYLPPTLAPARVFTQRDNLPTSVIEGVTEDRQRYLWLGTEQGIVRISEKDLLAPGNRPQVVPVVFGIDDGFRNAQLRTNSIFTSNDGDIWVMTLRELAEIDPRRIHANPLAASIIDRVNIDDQDVPPASGSSLSVPAGRHRLKIYYTLPEFRIPRRIRFRYRLDGWDKDWIQADNLRDATYTGITPGDYTFHVAHSDGYGNWSSAESALSIRVMPYFYQTSWFLTVIALLIAICISQLHRLRVAQVTDGINARMRERLQERTRIARELHDTLLQGMLGVSMQMYAASQQPHSNLWVLTLLSQASQRLRELAEDGRRAVDELRAPSAVPASLETILTLAVTDMNLRQMESKINSVGTRMELHPLVQREIEKIALEAIANAARHSGAKVIRLDITYQPAHFFLSISDDGCGISQETLTAPCPGHWGILGMRERAASIGSRLRILPHVPSGTVVEISLLGAIAYLDPPHSGIRTIWYRLRRRSHSHSFNARTQEKDQSDDQIA